jgi:hypothetical protein
MVVPPPRPSEQGGDFQDIDDAELLDDEEG